MAELPKKDVCVLIPAYNEEKNIGRVLSRLGELGYAAVVSDDGSSDGTAELSRSIGARVLTTDRNRGKGASIRRGLSWFLEQDYKALVLMDADGQHDPAEIGSFMSALARDGTHFVIGSRLHNPKKMPWVRLVTNRFMSWILSALAGQKIPDSQCGYRALKREVIEKISLQTSRFEIESEMILESARSGFKIISVPIISVYEGGPSHIRPVEDTFRFFRFLLGYFFKKK